MLKNVVLVKEFEVQLSIFSHRGVIGVEGNLSVGRRHGTECADHQGDQRSYIHMAEGHILAAGHARERRAPRILVASDGGQGRNRMPMPSFFTAVNTCVVNDFSELSGLRKFLKGRDRFRPQRPRTPYDRSPYLHSRNFYLCPVSLRKVPSCNSVNACCNCCWVFITIGPYHATGSSSGLPETSKNLIPSSPAWTVTSSPLSKRMSDLLSASAGGVVSAHLMKSVGTASGAEALQNFPLPPKT